MNIKILNKIMRYIYFFNYTKKSQIIWRLISSKSRKSSHKRTIKQNTYQSTTIYNYFWIEKHKTYQSINGFLTNKFCFLNKEVQFDYKIRWHNNGQNDLWNFNLNYFDYLSDICNEFEKTNNLSLLEKGIDFISQWVDESHEYSTITWAPYTISLRLLNWINFYSFMKKKDRSSSIPNKVIWSIKQQLIYLKKNLELDVLGNHLFENYKTIILTSYFLNESSNVLKYISKLNKELSRQVLSDGCHFEKSISYHLIVMNGILDILDVTNFDDQSTKILAGYADKMYRFYLTIRYSETKYPLFSDSNYSMTNSILNVDDKAKRVLSKNIVNKLDIPTLSKTSGYYVSYNNQMRLTMDLGDMGSSYLLAHAHNDINNFELRYFDNSFVVDTGVYQYEPSEEREYSRSTKAHNTIQVEEIEQSDIWGSFRIGYRPQKVTNKKIDEINNIQFMGEYTYKDKYNHIRLFNITPKSTILVDDYVISFSNRLHRTHLHFHPDVKVSDEEDYFRLENNGIIVYLYFSTNYKFVKTSEVKNVTTQYFPYFGVSVDRQSLMKSDNESKTEFIFSLEKIKDISLFGRKLLITYHNRDKDTLELKL